MKKIILIILTLVAVVAVFALKFKSEVKKISYEIDGFSLKISNFSDIVVAITSGVDAKLKINLNNFSNKAYGIKELFIELFTVDGDLIASPKKRTDNLSITPNGITTLNLEYHINTRGLYKLLKTALKENSLKEILNNYLENGELGTDINIKGFVKASNINLNINKLITI